MNRAHIGFVLNFLGGVLLGISSEFGFAVGYGGLRHPVYVWASFTGRLGFAFMEFLR